MLILAAAALTAALSIEAAPTSVAPSTQNSAKATCGIKTVGYRFRGTPGQQFRYGRGTYAVPAAGWIELEANRRQTTYLIAGKSVPVGQTPADNFGIREIALPSPAALASTQHFTEGGSK